MRKIDELTDPTSCWNKAKEYERVFVVLGRDPALPATIRAWAAERIALGENFATDPQIVSALKMATDIEAEKEG